MSTTRGLPHVVEQRGDGVEQAGCQQADAEIEHQTALQQLGRAFAVALGVEFADQGRVSPKVMPTAAMKKMKKTELPNDTAASGSGSLPP